MPYFAYKGRNPRGELVQGTLEGADSSAIADQLFNTGVTPVEIEATAPGVSRIAGGLLSQLRGGCGLRASACGPWGCGELRIVFA